MSEFRINELGQRQWFSCGTWFTEAEIHTHIKTVVSSYYPERFCSTEGMAGFKYAHEIVSKEE